MGRIGQILPHVDARGAKKAKYLGQTQGFLTPECQTGRQMLVEATRADARRRRLASTWAEVGQGNAITPSRRKSGEGEATWAGSN